MSSKVIRTADAARIRDAVRKAQRATDGAQRATAARDVLAMVRALDVRPSTARTLLGLDRKQRNAAGMPRRLSAARRHAHARPKDKVAVDIVD